EANDSTYWLFIELLWREYFNWSALKNGAKLFSFKGSAKAAPLTALYPERFQKWCYGNTPYPLVNACMQQLAKTGYLSNRGRQIAASCLVNELDLDWRHGAAWFEHQLVDYDVAVNWGNWQYIAGVGADPRGGRHFNLEKQTELFDADSSFRNRWVETPGDNMLDSRDAADWPIA
ncbi:MAG: FAD-binding domain-containing protein, partial [Pseudohongiellaceae bacterium]